jgi:hypothetical protein
MSPLSLVMCVCIKSVLIKVTFQKRNSWNFLAERLQFLLQRVAYLNARSKVSKLSENIIYYNRFSPNIYEIYTKVSYRHNILKNFSVSGGLNVIIFMNIVSTDSEWCIGLGFARKSLYFSFRFHLLPISTCLILSHPYLMKRANCEVSQTTSI